MDNKNYKYIFKTEQELGNEYGENWSSKFSYNLVLHLKHNELFGTEIVNCNSVKFSYITIQNDINTSYFIHGDLYKTIQVMDENISEKVTHKYIIKTEQEFFIEFGLKWRNLVKNKWITSMDKYLGKEIINPNIDKFNSIRIDSFSMSDDMYKKVKVEKTYKYIIKTETEMVSKYGRNWKSLTKLPFTLSMNYLLGKTIIDVEQFGDESISYKTIYGTFYLSDDIYDKVEITDDKSIDDISIDSIKYRMKSETELVNQFGISWVSKIRYAWCDELNNLYGKEINIIKNKRGDFVYQLKNGSNWVINKNMITEIKDTEKISYKFFVKNETEFELEFGSHWRKKLSKRWDDEMDTLFGTLLKDIIDVSDLNDCYQYKTPGNRYFYLSNDMIKKVVDNKSSNGNLDTKIELTIKCDNKSYQTHLWLKGKINLNEVDSILNSNEIKYMIIGKYDQNYTTKILNIVHTITKPINEYYKTIYTDSTIVDLINSTKTSINDNKIDLDRMTIDQLINLQDRIDEILFKRKHNLSDDEYEFYLENENMIEAKDVKSFMLEYKNDKFKMKKNKIRLTLKEKQVI